MQAIAAGLASRLLRHVRMAGVIDLSAMAADPQEALLADTSVSVRWVERSTLPDGCSIAATYLGDRTPAEITVATDTSSGRRRFSLVHEYGHHLRDQVPDVLNLLFSSVNPGQLEEKMCDAFASLVLVPEDERSRAFADGVTALAVIDLMSRVSASEQAVAVAAAESMTDPGYVVLLDGAGEVEFAGRSGDVFPIPSGAQQSGLAMRAASGITVRGIDRLNRGTNFTGELHLDGATGGGVTVLVAVDGRAPWVKFGGGRAYSAVFEDHLCEHCGKKFTALTAPCSRCGEMPCAECGRCNCHERALGGSRTCDGCWTLQPPAAFETPTTTTCLNCS